MRRPEPASAYRIAAAAGLGLVLVVVLVSAAIRLSAASVSPMFGEAGLRGLRALHRSAASLEVLAALGLAWAAWRRGVSSWLPIAAVLALTLFLAGLGIAAGRTPTAAQAMGNVLGGLALAAAFAWLAGEKGSGPFFCLAIPRVRRKRFLTPFLLGLLALQALIGARLSILGRSDAPALPLHALLGLGASGLLAWFALARIEGSASRAFFVLALAAPIAGFTALQYEYSPAAALVHAASAALLVVGCAFVLGRNA